MPFPWAAVAPPAELPGPAFDGPAVAPGAALAGAGEDGPGSGWCRRRGGRRSPEAGQIGHQTVHFSRIQRQRRPCRQPSSWRWALSEGLSIELADIDWKYESAPAPRRHLRSLRGIHCSRENRRCPSPGRRWHRATGDATPPEGDDRRIRLKRGIKIHIFLLGSVQRVERQRWGRANHRDDSSCRAIADRSRQ